MNKNVKRIIAITIVVLAALVGLSSLFMEGGMISYVSFGEARTAGSKVQVMGEIVNNGSSYDPESGSFTFLIADDTGDELMVIYGGTKPGNFDQATSVVCVGRFQNNAFHADKLLVKCPSKYQDEPAGKNT